MKRRNPRFRCRKIAEQISSAFAIEINKDIVRRILIRHYRPLPGGDGPSWLTVIGHARDSLWSVDLFRCESILLRSFWVMVVMDVFTRRIIGFGVAAANLDGPTICRMFNHAQVVWPLDLVAAELVRRYVTDETLGLKFGLGLRAQSSECRCDWELELKIKISGLKLERSIARNNDWAPNFRLTDRESQ